MSKSARLLDSLDPVRIALLGLIGGCAFLGAKSSLAQSDDPAATPNATTKGTLMVFDEPDALKKNSTVCNGFCGTEALAMNDEGTIVGYYIDANIVPRGYIRTPKGEFISFNAPKAGVAPDALEGTFPYTINDIGVVAGQYEDVNEVYHGFIRYPDDVYVVVDAPGADQTKKSGHGTQIYSNNIIGDTAGIYVDAAGTQHGFFRSAKGVFAEIHGKGAIATMVCEETCVGPDGTTVGFFYGSDIVLQGFIRTPDGTVTDFSAPLAGRSQGTGTTAASINAEGDITGYAIDNNGLAHGFIRRHDGTFINDFEVTNPPNGGTAAFSINLFGATTGISVDAASSYHGFARSAAGYVATIDASAEYAGTGAGQGTRPSVNNIFGQVAGWTIDSTGLQHGFVWTP